MRANSHFVFFNNEGNATQDLNLICSNASSLGGRQRAAVTWLVPPGRAQAVKSMPRLGMVARPSQVVAQTWQPEPGHAGLVGPSRVSLQLFGGRQSTNAIFRISSDLLIQMAGISRVTSNCP